MRVEVQMHACKIDLENNFFVFDFELVNSINQVT